MLINTTDATFHFSVSNSGFGLIVAPFFPKVSRPGSSSSFRIHPKSVNLTNLRPVSPRINTYTMNEDLKLKLPSPARPLAVARPQPLTRRRSHEPHAACQKTSSGRCPSIATLLSRSSSRGTRACTKGLVLGRLAVTALNNVMKCGGWKCAVRAAPATARFDLCREVGMSVVVTLHNLHVACTRLRAVARASTVIFVFFTPGAGI